MTIDDFIPLLPLHRRALERLREQRRIDPIGALGWGALLDLEDLEGLSLSLAEVLKPLHDRGLVGDCVEFVGKGGLFLGRITPVGLLCLNFGLMPRQPMILSSVVLKDFFSNSGL